MPIKKIVTDECLPNLSDEYTALQRLGGGNFGDVFLAVETATGELLAVKIIRDTDRVPVKLRRREVEVMKRLRHPNIVGLLSVQYHDMRESLKEVHLYMEYCNNGDLYQYLKANGPLSEDVTLNIIRQTASGMQHLDQYNLIHRDLKPHNLLLHGDPAAGGTVKIADFGFSRALENGFLAKTLVGSPFYCAPELLNGQPYDSRVDVWSLGVIIYQLLVNEVPCKANNPISLAQKLLCYPGGHISLPDEVDVSDSLRDLVKNMLCIDPCGRLTWPGVFNHAAVDLSNYSVETPDEELAALVADGPGLLGPRTEADVCAADGYSSGSDSGGIYNGDEGGIEAGVGGGEEGVVGSGVGGKGKGDASRDCGSGSGSILGVQPGVYVSPTASRKNKSNCGSGVSSRDSSPATPAVGLSSAALEAPVDCVDGDTAELKVSEEAVQIAASMLSSSGWSETTDADGDDGYCHIPKDWVAVNEYCDAQETSLGLENTPDLFMVTVGRTRQAATRYSNLTGVPWGSANEALLINVADDLGRQGLAVSQVANEYVRRSENATADVLYRHSLLLFRTGLEHIREVASQPLSPNLNLAAQALRQQFNLVWDVLKVIALASDDCDSNTAPSSDIIPSILLEEIESLITRARKDELISAFASADRAYQTAQLLVSAARAVGGKSADGVSALETYGATCTEYLRSSRREQNMGERSYMF